MAAAKAAGFFVTAIDAFADIETSQLADEVLMADVDVHGFDRVSLLNIVSRLPHDYLGFVYGSGFEAQPTLLAELALYVPLIGNTPNTTANIKNPAFFFTTLQKLNILYPAVLLEKPLTCDDLYLNKSIGGCGGTHIKLASTNTIHDDQTYYQAYVEGRAVSLLFLANGHQIVPISFNEQWVSATALNPFRYGGAVSNTDLSGNVKAQILNAASKLCIEFQLLGLNSIDVMVQDAMVYVLEINARLTATFDLYKGNLPRLFEKHIASCLPGFKPNVEVCENIKFNDDNASKAHAILYMESDIFISDGFDWPEWAIDTPHLPQKIQVGAPVCTVFAQAQNAVLAKQMVLIRVRIIKVQLLKQASYISSERDMPWTITQKH